MSHTFSSPSSQEEDNRGFRYKCPADFLPLQSSCREKCVLNTGANTELWLIKAPTGFNPSSLANMKVSLSGLEIIQSTGTSSQIYSVLSSCSSPTDLHLLTSSGKKQKSSSLSDFTGILSISESYGDCSENRSPIPVPAALAPSFPTGLKQRFQPFGSSTPACAHALSPPKKAMLESEGTENKTKKKKKKKEKHSRGETTEVSHIKQEEISSVHHELFVPELVEEVDSRAERKKKKKIKKEKKEAVDASFNVKQEPVDEYLDDLETSVKKKKKKKEKHH